MLSDNTMVYQGLMTQINLPHFNFISIYCEHIFGVCLYLYVLTFYHKIRVLKYHNCFILLLSITLLFNGQIFSSSSALRWSSL